MKPLGLSINRLARDLHLPPNRISASVNERRGISGDTALRLSRYFGTSAVMWMNLQKRYELEVAEGELAASIKRQVKPLKREIEPQAA